MPKVNKVFQLSKEDRVTIEVLLSQGYSLRKIAEVLCRAPSTISREVRRNSIGVYKADRAQKLTVKRHKIKPKRVYFNDHMKAFIRHHLEHKRWSPEYISAKGREQDETFVSGEWIYRWVWKMKFSLVKADRPFGGMYNYLKHGHRRKRRGRIRNKRGNILYRRWIEERSAEANDRSRQGHMEVDTVLGKDRKPGLLVMLDRKTRKTWICKLESKETRYVMKKAREMCKKIGGVKSLTFDNDPSFAHHYKLNGLCIETFFTRPYSSQDKGSVENRIGVIRQFFPKKTDFTKIHPTEILKVQTLVNDRPMRMFNYKSPNEMHKSCSKKPKVATVAFIS